VGIERCRRNQEKLRHSSLRHSDIEAKLKPVLLVSSTVTARHSRNTCLRVRRSSLDSYFQACTWWPAPRSRLSTHNLMTESQLSLLRRFAVCLKSRVADHHLIPAEIAGAGREPSERVNAVPAGTAVGRTAYKPVAGHGPMFSLAAVVDSRIVAVVSLPAMSHKPTL